MEYIIFLQSRQERMEFISRIPLIPVELIYGYWSTLWMIIQYSSFKFGGRCFFILNRRKGFFNKKDEGKMDQALFIGGHPGEK